MRRLAFTGQILMMIENRISKKMLLFYLRIKTKSIYIHHEQIRKRNSELTKLVINQEKIKRNLQKEGFIQRKCSKTKKNSGKRPETNLKNIGRKGRS